MKYVERMVIEQLQGAYMKLRNNGWREIIHCPKDGTVFEVLEVGSTGIHKCHYQGEWPDGGWWIHDGGDLWPSRPILFRPIATESEEEGR